MGRFRTLQRFPQDAKGNTLRTANYVAPVLVGCGVAEYDGRQSERSASRRRIDKYMMP